MIHRLENPWRSTLIAQSFAEHRFRLRWATGGFEILFKSNPFSRKLKLTLDQRLQYFGTATFYLMGVTPGLLLLVPPLQIEQPGSSRTRPQVGFGKGSENSE